MSHEIEQRVKRYKMAWRIMRLSACLMNRSPNFCFTYFLKIYWFILSKINDRLCFSNRVPNSSWGWSMGNVVLCIWVTRASSTRKTCLTARITYQNNEKLFACFISMSLYKVWLESTNSARPIGAWIIWRSLQSSDRQLYCNFIFPTN